MKDVLSNRIKMGDRQAFELLFRKYFARLCIFSAKFLDDPEESRETVQDVFARLWEGRDDIDCEENLEAYLFRITQNTCINKLRHNKVKSKYAEIYKMVYIDNEISPHESFIANELNDRINVSVSNLPPRCKSVFEMSRFDGLKYNQIATILNISVKTVEAQMSKALKILRTELRNYL
jgi:RNA polymerase sigma-70 factor, ECF subfamily